MLSRRRPEAAEQREDREPDDAEHGDLAEGVEGAEVDQDHVDDVGAAALGIGVLEEVGRRLAVAAAGSSPHARWRRCPRRRPPPPRGRRRGAAARGTPRRGRSASRRLGSQRSPSSSRTVVMISTSSWVTARSGAENQTKVTQVTTPAPPSSARAAKRWYFACQAAPMAQAAPASQTSAKTGSRSSVQRRAAEQAGVPELPAQRAEGEQHQDAELRLQPLGAGQPVERARPAPPEGDEAALEDALALEQPQQRRPLGAPARASRPAARRAPCRRRAPPRS